jgi:hypothetical protein
MSQGLRASSTTGLWRSSESGAWGPSTCPTARRRS